MTDSVFVQKIYPLACGGWMAIKAVYKGSRIIPLDEIRKKFATEKEAQEWCKTNIYETDTLHLTGGMNIGYWDV